VTAATAVVFCMGDRGHVTRMLPVVDGLARAGVTTHVFTAASFRAEVAAAGGRFVDLFASHTLADADRTSIPLPSRFVTFASRFGAEIADEVRALAPTLVVHDTFAVIGHVVANHLGVPRVNVCAGHNQPPARTVAELLDDPRVAIDPACWTAAADLRDRHGIADASPFSYITGVSPWLNVYCEPPAFLPDDQRGPFEPVAFFGSLAPPSAASSAPASAGVAAFRTGATLRLYASVGTVVWRYFHAAAVGVLDAVASAVAGRDDAEAVISVGRAEVPEAARWASHRVRVESYVDQWALLGEATVCVTHQGLNSTHEAIFSGVPMISYPFFGDQPGLASRCRELGLSMRLTEALRGPVTVDDVNAAIDRVADARIDMTAALARARAWELDVIDSRPAVIRRMLALMAVS
jgi:MGT family glycosyltransferase